MVFVATAPFVLSLLGLAAVTAGTSFVLLFVDPGVGAVIAVVAALLVALLVPPTMDAKLGERVGKMLITSPFGCISGLVGCFGFGCRSLSATTTAAGGGCGAWLLVAAAGGLLAAVLLAVGFAVVALLAALGTLGEVLPLMCVDQMVFSCSLVCLAWLVGGVLRDLAAADDIVPDTMTTCWPAAAMPAMLAVELVYALCQLCMVIVCGCGFTNYLLLHIDVSHTADAGHGRAECLSANDNSTCRRCGVSDAQRVTESVVCGCRWW